jgi:acyl-CoA reductase-like NAD-dependent aldehyde dehydrogenase
VLTDVTVDMVITKQETFGPVAPFYRFKTDDETIEMGIWPCRTNEGIISTSDRDRPVRRLEGKRHRPAKALNTASRSCWRLSTSAWAASTASLGRGR